MSTPMRQVPRAWGIALGVLAASAALGLLYLGRSILVPVTLAVLLCFAISPLVRKLRLFGLGHVSSVLGAVAVTVLVISLLAGLIGVRAVQMAARLPTYQATLERNVRSARILALSPMEKTWDAAESLLDPVVTSGVDDRSIAVEVLQPKPAPMQRLQRLLSWVWGPIGSAGIVVIVLPPYVVGPIVIINIGFDPWAPWYMVQVMIDFNFAWQKALNFNVAHVCTPSNPN